MTRDEPHNVRFFEFLSEEEWGEFVEAAEFAVLEPGEVLIEEGAKPSNLFVLTSGQVEVLKRIPGHGDRLLAVLDATNERTVVGERGLLGDRGASATVRASGEVEAVKIPRETFRRMISEGRPAAYKLAHRIARILAHRLARLDEEVVETVRELESGGETDLEAFRDKLITEWTL
jgi:CRP/FNR family transcriptional regulator, cyclic AMP receptor protein